MKITRILATVPLLSFLVTLEAASCPRPAAQSPSDLDTVRVFLVAGQSNAEGADSPASGTVSLPTFQGALAPQKVRFWYETNFTDNIMTSGGWIPLQPELQRQIFGPEITFAREVMRKSRGPVAIIKSTCGGTNLAVDWDPGNPSGQRMYERTITLMQTALADLTSEGIDWRLEGVLWQQGENDMLNSTYVNEYGMRLSALMDRFRADLGTPRLQWYVGETSFKGIWGIDFRSNMQILRSQQLVAIAADPFAQFVPTSHLAFLINYGQSQPHYHFGPEGQLQLGEAYAAAYLQNIGVDQSHGSEPFCCGTPADPGSTVRVFVLAGQRSMEGEQAYVAEIEDHPEFAALVDPQHDVLYRYRLGGGAHTATDWAPLGPADYLETFGPELSFGATVSGALDDPVAILKVTDGAAFLEDWLSSSPNASRPQYADAVSFIQAALADLRADGLNPVLEAVVWLPGEHDAWWGPFRNQYAANLTTLVSSLRSDLSAPGLEWWVAELSDNLMWGAAKLDALDAQIQSVANADPLLWFVDTDAVPVAAQSPTFGTAGVLHLGELMADAYLNQP
ncbi:MAG: sialate O-acetylesterase [bacterium]|nr:sialate O-acetylesterase [bacterium]